MANIRALSDKIYRFILFFSVIFLAFSLFMRQVYVNDWVRVYGKGVDRLGISLKEFDIVDALISYIYQGRIFYTAEYVFEYIVYRAGIDLTHRQWVLSFIMILCFSFSACIIYEAFWDELRIEDKDRGSKAVLACAVIVGVASPALIEWFTYSFVCMSWSMIFSSLAVRYFQKKSYGKAFVWYFVAVGCYQAFYSFFLIYVLTLLLIRSQSRLNKEICIEAVKAGCIDVLGVAIVVSIAPLCETVLGTGLTREVDFSNGMTITERIIHIIPRYGLNILTSGGVLPTGMMLGLLLFLLPFLVVKIWRRNGLNGLLCLFFYISALVLLPPAFAVALETPYVPTRTMFSLYAAVGCYFIVWKEFVLDDKDNATLKMKAFMGLVVGYLFISVICINMINSEVYKSNAIEIGITKGVDSFIKQYEITSGTKINKVSTVHYRDEGQPAFDRAHFFYFGPYFYVQHLLLYTSWSDVAALNYFNGTNYQDLNMTDEERDKYFSNFDAGSLEYFDPDKQLVFDGDTCYWALY